MNLTDILNLVDVQTMIIVEVCTLIVAIILCTIYYNAGKTKGKRSNYKILADKTRQNNELFRQALIYYLLGKVEEIKKYCEMDTESACNRIIGLLHSLRSKSVSTLIDIYEYRVFDNGDDEKYINAIIDLVYESTSNNDKQPELEILDLNNLDAPRKITRNQIEEVIKRLAANNDYRR